MLTNKKTEESKDKSYNPALRYMGMGMQMFALFAIAAWLGISLDNFLEIEQKPFSILFVLIAAFGSFYKLFKSLQ